MISLVSSWASTLSLVFGGCCANALTLEQLTLTYPNFGSLITFLQFLIISLHGIPQQIEWTRYGPRFKPRRIPLLPYFGQVSLFYLISLLNNAAFAYRIPMAVHIIFRSGGLVVSMVLGWLIAKKRYNLSQVTSVFLVTVGVVLTTLSASKPSKTSDTSSNPYEYATGIGILSLALIFSGLLGLLQDWTFTHYGRPTNDPNARAAPTWQESMFYLHLLGLPMFIPLFGDIKRQFHTITYDSPRTTYQIPVPYFSAASENLPPLYRIPALSSLLPEFLKKNEFIYPTADSVVLSIPKPYPPLFLNTVTQLLCVAGVNSLVSRVSALTVTLILVVRKAVSLVISLKGGAIVDALAVLASKVGIDGSGSLGAVVSTFLGLEVASTKSRPPADVSETMLWSGAGFVLLGTIAYSIGTGMAKKNAEKESKKNKKKRE